jgi:hypothetical protein
MEDAPRSKMLRATLGDLAFWAGVRQLQNEIKPLQDGDIFKVPAIYTDAIKRPFIITAITGDDRPLVPWTLTERDKMWMRRIGIAE